MSCDSSDHALLLKNYLAALRLLGGWKNPMASNYIGVQTCAACKRAFESIPTKPEDVDPARAPLSYLRCGAHARDPFQQ